MKLILSILLITLIFTGCGSNEEFNLCDEYANAEKVSISFPDRTYSFNGIEVSEKEIKEACSTY